MSVFGKMKPKKLIKGVAKTAMKASPIPIPDIVQEQLGLASDAMKSIEVRIDKLEDMLTELLEFSRELKGWLDADEQDTTKTIF